MTVRKKVLLVFPTAWDERQLRACEPRWREEYAVEPTTPSDHDWEWNLDVLRFIDEQVTERSRSPVHGVLSSSDYPGATVAGAIARRLGLPGTRPENVIGCSHKYYSRLAQQEVVPEATPWFELLDPKLPDAGAPGLHFPCFVKPVKGAFSVMSGRMDDREELTAFFSKACVSEFLTYYVHVFNQLVRGLTPFEVDGSYFLAEELLKGRQVTVEGCVTSAGIKILGIVDSVRHPATKSFVRFDYPSSLSKRVRERMADVARRVVERLGLESTLFNIEMTYDPRRDRIFIIEVNPRMCGQFADLYEKVDGVNGYQVALAVATGRSPTLARGEGRHSVASSFPLRIFRPSRVVRAPSASELAEVESRFPGALVWPECAEGDTLVDFESVEDGKSVRYAVVNLGAEDRQRLHLRFDEITSALDYRFEPVR